MKLQNIVERLQKLHPKEIDLSLDRTKNLLEKLGNPQDKIKAISVVGTNGKNSTINAIFSILSGLLILLRGEFILFYFFSLIYFFIFISRKIKFLIISLIISFASFISFSLTPLSLICLGNKYLLAILIFSSSV